MIDIPELKTELDTDPTARGYSGTSDAEAANLLNEVQVGLAIDRLSVPLREVLEAIVPADWVALNDAQRAALLLYASLDSINPNAANVVQAFSGFFAATATLTALNALRTRDGSRAEELWTDGARVHHSHVTAARGL